MKISDKFVPIAETPCIAMDGIVEPVNPFTGKKIVPKNNPFPFVMYDSPWRSVEQEKYKYKVNKGIYRVNNEDIFNMENWEVVHEN